MLKYRKFLKLNLNEKFLLFFVSILSIYFSLIVFVFPFSFVVKLLGEQGKAPSNAINDSKYQKVKSIEKAIGRISRHFPVKVKCLAKAMAAKYILKKLNIPSTLYLGVALEKTKKMDAHAWLICNGVVISGKEEVSRFKPLVFFS